MPIGGYGTTPSCPAPPDPAARPGRMYCQPLSCWRAGAGGLFTIAPTCRWRCDHGISMAAARRIARRAAECEEARRSCSPPPST